MTSDGSFDGHITTGQKTFYIEPSGRYLKDAPFHSVIYSSDDVLHPSPSDDSSSSCKSHELHLKVNEDRINKKVPTSTANDDNQAKSFMHSHNFNQILPVIQTHNNRSKRSTTNTQEEQQGQLFEALPESNHMHQGSPVVVQGAQRQVMVQ